MTLIQEHRETIVLLARRFATEKVGEAELVTIGQEAVILANAVSSGGYKMKTYASWWIRYAMTTKILGLKDQGRLFQAILKVNGDGLTLNVPAQVAVEVLMMITGLWSPAIITNKGESLANLIRTRAGREVSEGEAKAYAQKCLTRLRDVLPSGIRLGDNIVL